MEACGSCARPALLRSAEIVRYRPVQLTRAQPDLLPVHFTGRICLPSSFRLGLCFPLDPRGVLAAGIELCPLRVDAARGFVRAGLQLIEPGGAPVISGDRSGSLGLRSSRLGCRGLRLRRGLGYCWPELPGLRFELRRGGVRFFVPGLWLALWRPRPAVERWRPGARARSRGPRHPRAPGSPATRRPCSAVPLFPGGWLLPAALQFSFRLPGYLPGAGGPGGPFLIPGVRGFEAARLCGQRGSQRPGVLCPHLVVFCCGVG